MQLILVGLRLKDSFKITTIITISGKIGFRITMNVLFMEIIKLFADTKTTSPGTIIIVNIIKFVSTEKLLMLISALLGMHK